MEATALHSVEVSERETWGHRGTATAETVRDSHSRDTQTRTATAETQRHSHSRDTEGQPQQRDSHSRDTEGQTQQRHTGTETRIATVDTQTRGCRLKKAFDIFYTLVVCLSYNQRYGFKELGNRFFQILVSFSSSV